MGGRTTSSLRYLPFLVIAVAVGLATILLLRPPAPDDTGLSGVPDPYDGAFWTDVPRPAGAVAAACDPMAGSAVSGQSLVERAEALRTLGLFDDLAALDRPALEAELTSRQAGAWGGLALDPRDPLADYLVASLDASRVWWEDLEADVVEENQVYVRVLEEWAGISRGAFAPTGITERWDTREGPVHVAFGLGGSARELRPAYLYDWIDPRILMPLNELISETGRQFEAVKAFDQTAIVLVLTPEEKGGLEQQRGWCFQWPG